MLDLDLLIDHPLPEESVASGLSSSLVFHELILLGDKQEINMRV